MKILLHVCCAPCFLGVIDRVLSDFSDSDITLYFYNPNIFPKSEYDKRLDTLKEVVKLRYDDLKIVSEEYDEKEFYHSVLGLENEAEGGARCDKCISIRMRESAKYAKEHNFDYFTTTLSVSPHKNYNVIKEIGQNLEKEYDIKFIDTDFKKKDGFLKSTKVSKEMGIYRQNYCGCEFSKR